ncbi:MAG: hybrid sensor histidine kinase/response regulator [Emcibacter sp.]|nr:hybrid sensor histidine kinase/response regulator [Emcibacter sp.]
MDDLLSEFLTETSESIDVVDVELVTLEQDPTNKPILDNIFRLVHTIKGTCGFLGLPRLETVAHAGENVLGKFRDGELVVTPGAVTLILAALDRIKEILAGLEATQEEPEGDDSDLISQLNIVASGGTIDGAAPVAEKAAEEDDMVLPEITQSTNMLPGQVSLEELEAAFAAAPGPDDEDNDENVAAEESAESQDDNILTRIGGVEPVKVIVHLFHNRILADATVKGLMAGINTRDSKDKMGNFFTACLSGKQDAGPSVSAAFAGFISHGITEEQNETICKLLTSVLEEVDLPPLEVDAFVETYRGVSVDILAEAREASKNNSKKGKDAATTAKKSGENGVANQSIRVNVQVLEDLMTMVSELVLTRNQLMQLLRNSDDSEFSIPLQRLSQCTTELQEGVMKTRMQPVGNAWAKLPRIIRDLQLELDKKIDLQMLGADTELDRQVLEMIKDPLTHMVRNSADHGIEMPADRLAAGKKETGTVRLNAFHEGGHIIIEITDDGAGLPVEKLKAKALKNELATQEELDEMSDNQIQRFIFHAGFSTAEKVTAVSGRGVGMDVVRSNIEKIGGTVDLKSIEGKGTSFSIKIPLTLAIVSALIVKCREEKFAIPQISVLELVRASHDSEHRIEHINNTPVLRLRDRLLPLIRLDEILGMTDAETDTDEAKSKEDYIVISQVGTFTFGIVVDQVFDTEEIVVKPVAPILRDLHTFAGNTILGDGKVIMILDPNGIVSQIGDNMNDTTGFGMEEEETLKKTKDDREAILLFGAGGNNCRAVPLSLVARLEEIDVASIEKSDGKPVFQYRGRLMPLVTLDDSYQLKEEGRQPVLVFTDGDKTMGIAVDEILDILEDEIDIELSSGIQGQVGTAVINGNATEIIDVAHYIEKAFGTLGTSSTSGHMGIRDQSHLLLIDDSKFFLNMIKPLLSAAGYKITAVDNAGDALRLREKGQDFDLIISDIEMPDMDGFGFAEKVREGGIWQKTPMVALSSHQTPKDFARGREVGFDDYVVKLDRESLMSTIVEQIGKTQNAA